MTKQPAARPLDFLGREITAGDWIVYPTGGTSCRMVLARVVGVTEREHGYVWDGLRGPSRFVVIVNRYREGVRAAGEGGYWAVDSSRKVRLDQLHRIVIVPAPEGAES